MGPLRSEDPARGRRADSWGRRRTERSGPRCCGTHLAPCALRGFIVPEPQGIARRRSLLRESTSNDPPIRDVFPTSRSRIRCSSSDTPIISEVRKGARCDVRVAGWYAGIEDAGLHLSVLVIGEIRKGIESARPRRSAQGGSARMLAARGRTGVCRAHPADRRSGRRPVGSNERPASDPCHRRASRYWSANLRRKSRRPAE